MNNQQMQPKQMQPKQMQTKDKDVMNEILTMSKAGADLFLHGTLEANSQNVHEAFKSALTETLTIQNDTYKVMQQKGWYPTENVPPQKIEQTKQKLANSQ